LPSNARERFKRVLELQDEMVRYADASPFNRLALHAEERGVGIIASGLGYNYVMENYPIEAVRPSILKISTYPLPESKIHELVAHVDTVLVVEEGFPLIERALRGLYGVPGKIILGKLGGALPLQGELTPESVRAAVGLAPLARQSAEGFALATRPPQLCVGCPHADTFKALKAALAGHPGAVVFSDIGCYTLGYFPPHNAVDTCVCMGASVGMAHGASNAGIHPAVGVIGDSTFGHSGMTALLSAAAADARMVLVILDNGTVAMTGTQPSFATGQRLLAVVAGLGVAKEHIRVITPLPKFHDENTRVFLEEIAHPGLSVVIAVRECLEEAKKKNKHGEAQ
jgi:indolepyruvate ferredoxin oxidoreductase alpha subunit